MSWVDDGFEEQRRFDRKRANVGASFHAMFTDLWKEISERVDEAAKKGIAVYTNGTTWERKVVLTRRPVPFKLEQDSEVLIVSADKSNEMIMFMGPNIEGAFLVDLCPDNIACLKYADRQVAIDEAARIILSPFLFPESAR